MSTGHCDKHCTRRDKHHWGRCVGVLGERWVTDCPRCYQTDRVAAMVETLRFSNVHRLPDGQLTFRYTTPQEVADRIRGET